MLVNFNEKWSNPVLGKSSRMFTVKDLLTGQLSVVTGPVCSKELVIWRNGREPVTIAPIMECSDLDTMQLEAERWLLSIQLSDILHLLDNIGA